MEQVDEVRPASSGVVARIQTVRGFIESVRSELRKVTWPTRPELMKATRMVVILSLVLGIAIGLLDWLLQLILVRGVAALAQ